MVLNLRVEKQGVLFTDETLMPFGKYAGKKLEKVPASYLLWLADQKDFKEKNPQLSAYIEANRELMEDQVVRGD